MLAVFLGTGLFLSAKTNFYQITGLGDWLKSTVGSVIGSKNRKTDKSSVSQLGALFSSLAACLGTGNITGVATALFAGGTLSQEDKDKYFESIMKTYLACKEKAKEKYGKKSGSDE